MASQYKKLRSTTAPLGTRPLPYKQKVAIYSRVSTNAQIGNESSRIQTDGMKNRLLSWGYAEADIIMIDMDEGISGRKGPDQRPGMKRVFELIQMGQIGAVATEHASRFFRDQKMIDANIFIDLCRQHDVRLIIGDKLYDVNHPVSGPDDIRIIRQKFEEAARYLEQQIYGTLLPARHAVGMRGEWDGRGVLPGFLVDMRQKLPDGRDNPNYRKPVPYEPEAEVIREWFRLLKRYKGNLTATWRHIRQYGPYLPDRSTAEIAVGFYLSAFQYKRDPDTGHILISRNALENLLTNITYVGGWRYSDRAVNLDNHEPIVELELFMAVFNLLSPVDFWGEPNPHYQPQRAWTRHHKAERTCPEPIYYGLIVSDDVPGKPQKQVVSGYEVTTKAYHYKLSKGHTEGTEWCIKCGQADAVIDGMLLERIQCTQMDETAFQEALASVERGDNRTVVRLQHDIQQEERLKRNLSASLGTLDEPELIRDVQARYQACSSRLASFRRQLEAAGAQVNQADNLETAPQVLETVIAHWNETEPEDRRDLMVELAQHIEITKTGRLTKRIIVHWKDGGQSAVDIRNKGRGHTWSEEELQQLKQMVEANADQVALLRAFPELSWHNIMHLYARHFNQNKRPKFYTGVKSYTNYTRWEDTQEYQNEQESQPPSSSSDGMNAGTQDQLRPFDWFDLTNPPVLNVLRAMAGSK